MNEKYRKNENFQKIITKYNKNAIFVNFCIQKYDFYKN